MDFLETMRAVWADSLDGIVIADPETRIIDVNPAYCRLSGFSREELIGQKTNIIRSGLTPRAVFDDMWRSLRSTGKWVGELINQRPDQTLWISFLSITRVSGPDGEPVAYVGIARDLTERRHLEDQLRQQTTRLAAVLEAIVSGVLMLDNEGRCVVANRNLARLVGCEVADLLGRTRAELDQRLVGFFDAPDVLSPPEPAGTRSLASRAPHPRYFAAYWSPVVAAAGAKLGQIFVFRDVTRETEVDRMKSEFIATVSHELRTPMTSVKGALGLLLGGAAGPVPGPQQELLQIAHSNIDRLIRLINDILDLSRIESGRLELRRVPMDLNQAVSEALRELDSMRQQRNLQLRIDLAPDLPPVHADPDRLVQVVSNLVGNAYKFTEPGGRVTVRTVAHDGQVRVVVADTGPGIPADQLHSIFERFTRASTVASKKAGGTGLGLAIVRAIIQEHGGRVWAESEPGQGATFAFELPALTGRARRSAAAGAEEAGVNAAGAEEAGVKAAATAAGTRAAPGPTVLICDDDPDILRLLGMELRQAGFRVVETRSGEEALARCAAGDVDCVALDLLMPGMHGLEVARRLKENPATRSIPIIIISAYLDRHQTDLAMLGVSGVVAKPINQGRLLDQIAGAVGDRPRHEGPPEVLVVDDDPTMRRVVEMTLQEAGYRVRQAPDGMAALHAIGEKPPDLLVLDLLMPNLDGFRLVRTLQEHPRTRRIPLLILTALDLNEAERGVLHLGPTAHLIKGPKLREQLISRVRELVGKPREQNPPE